VRVYPPNRCRWFSGSRQSAAAGAFTEKGTPMGQDFPPLDDQPLQAPNDPETAPDGNDPDTPPAN